MATAVYVDLLACMDHLRGTGFTIETAYYYKPEFYRLPGRCGWSVLSSLVNLMNLAVWNKIKEDQWLSAPVGVITRCRRLSLPAETNHLRKLKADSLLRIRGRGDNREVQINWKEIQRRLNALSR